MLRVWRAEVHLGPAQGSYLPPQGKAKGSARRGAAMRKTRAMGGRPQKHRPAGLPYLEPQPWWPGTKRSRPGGGGRRRAPCSGPRRRLWLLGGCRKIWAPQFPLPPPVCGRNRSCGASRGHGTGTCGLPGTEWAQPSPPERLQVPHAASAAIFGREGWALGTHCVAHGHL